MGSIVLYIIEWAFALIVLLTIYKVAFSGTTFYRFNRFYLLGATVLSAILPFLHITIPERTPVMGDMAIERMEFAQELSGTFILIGEPQMMVVETSETAGHSMWAVILVFMYSAYVLMLLVGWSRSIIRARRFLRGKNRRRISRTVWLVTHDESFGPFSWMNYIVISDTENGFARRASLRHEFAHIRLLHSADLVFLLACTVVNPVCWLVLQEIRIVHEFEADSEVINRYGIRNSDYQKLLIMRTVGAEAYALASSFNLNIKKRIIMLNKNQTSKRRLMWLLLLIPMLGMTSVLFGRTEIAVTPDNIPPRSLSDYNGSEEQDGSTTPSIQWIYLYDATLIGKEYNDFVYNILLSSIGDGQERRIADLPEVKALRDAYESSQKEAEAIQRSFTTNELLPIENETNLMVYYYERQRDTLPENQRSKREQEIREAKDKLQQKHQELNNIIKKGSDEMKKNLMPQMEAAWQSLFKIGPYVCIDHFEVNPPNEAVVASGNLESALEDLFEGHRNALYLQYSDVNLQQLKSLLTEKYRDKVIIYTAR